MFNFSNKKQTVGFSVTPGIGLEAVIIDKSSNTILNYARRKIDYNFTRRNIQNYAQFKNALVELVEELKIPPKSYAYLVLPNVYFDFIEITRETTDSEIGIALESVVEEFYIFQKVEPVIGWCEVANSNGYNQKKLAYSAFQKSDVEEISEIFASLDLQLAGIETAYSATLRGLNLTGQIKDAILMGSSWSALLINNNSYTLFQMEGKNLLECNEVPLAIKSFSTEEAYQAIVSSAGQLLSRYDASQLYIISQTDDISASALKRIMQFDREIIAFDSNKYSEKQLLESANRVNFPEAESMTLAVLGATDPKSDFGLNLNILNNDPNASMGVYCTVPIFGKMTEVTQSLIQNATLAFSFVLVVIFLILIGGSLAINDMQTKEVKRISSKISTINRKITELEKVEVKKEEIDMTNIIDEVAQDNVSAISFYDSISTDIPKNVWLTRYYNKNGNHLAIRGVAESIVDIYEYYKNLRIVSPKSDIKLTELKVVTNVDGRGDKDDLAKFISGIALDADIDRLYSFVISNTEFSIEPINNAKPTTDESNILVAPPRAMIDEPSSQMKPVA